MKVTFLGTNGWYDTETGNTTCIMIETGEEHIILDAGFGFYKAKDIIKDDKPVLLFISHFHLDHLIGLHTLPLFKFKQGIDIYTQRPGERLLRSLLKRPFSSPPLLLGVKLRFHEITKKTRFRFGFETAALRHSVPCYGYRFASGGSTAAYCTDTGLCASLKRLAKGADLLMAECAMAPRDKSANPFHLTPEASAGVAAGAGAGKLALFHFDPGKYPAFEDRERALAAARALFPHTIASRDGLELSI